MCDVSEDKIGLDNNVLCEILKEKHVPIDPISNDVIKIKVTINTCFISRMILRARRSE